MALFWAVGIPAPAVLAGSCPAFRAQAVWVVAHAAWGQAPGCGQMTHPAEEYIGYTWFHLPKKDVAKPAILAARMARSSLDIRRLLK